MDCGCIVTETCTIISSILYRWSPLTYINFNLTTQSNVDFKDSTKRQGRIFTSIGTSSRRIELNFLSLGDSLFNFFVPCTFKNQMIVFNLDVVL